MKRQKPINKGKKKTAEKVKYKKALTEAKSKSMNHMKDKRFCVNYYRWEFLRRNKKYQDEYRLLLRSPRGAFYEGYPREEKESDNAYTNRLKKSKISTDNLELTTRNEYLKKNYEITRLLDPNRPASQLFEQELFSLFECFPVLECQDSYDVKEVVKEDIPPGLLFIRVDLGYPKRDIKTEFDILLDYKQRRYKIKKFSEEGHWDYRAQFKLYDDYLKTWDLKDKGKTLREIAKICYPEEYPDELPSNDERREQLVSNALENLKPHGSIYELRKNRHLRVPEIFEILFPSVTHKDYETLAKSIDDIKKGDSKNEKVLIEAMAEGIIFQGDKEYSGYKKPYSPLIKRVWDNYRQANMLIEGGYLRIR